jgi:ferredoxin--NADP+ reductase
VNCIHPRLDDTAFTTAESLYIDPDACIDCGACVEECPVGAIVADDELTDSQARYLDISSAYFRSRAHSDDDLRMTVLRPSADLTGFRVAVVGSGPAGMYAVWELLEHQGIAVDVYDRSWAPFGLIRTGVAPDHPGTKKITTLFERAARKPNVTMHLGVEVGTHVSHEELSAAHSAVIYATGASATRTTRLPGEHLDGVHSATKFVGWYNGDPDHADLVLNLSGERAVIIGNGNVALDVARVLLTDPAELIHTDIAEHALKALGKSTIREVVIVGRRGPAQAAYSSPELIALLDLPGVDVIIDPADTVIDPATAEQLSQSDVEPAARLKAALAEEISRRPPTGATRRIVFKYRRSPTRFCGANKLSSVRLARNTLVPNGDGSISVQTGPESDELSTGLVLEAVGHRGVAVKGVPFDVVRGVIPNHQGRVLASPGGEPLPGVYVTGWIKRGPSGVIGSNKRCARETVTQLVADAATGVVVAAPDQSDFRELLRRRQPNTIGFDGWRRIDAAETRAGQRRGRPRIKFTEAAAMLRAATGDGQYSPDQSGTNDSARGS